MTTEQVKQVIDSEIEKHINSANLMDENTEVEEHSHKWTRGMLPGPKYIKQCKCGEWKEIDSAAWQTLA